MLVLSGNTVVKPDWEIHEREGAGYSRIYYVHSGEAFYTADNQQARLIPGRVYIMPNNIPYQIRRNRNMDFVCTYLHVDMPMVQINGMIELEPQADSSLYYYLQFVRKLIDEGQKELLCNVAECIVHYCRESVYCSNYSEFLCKLSSYIQEHISEKITVDELSALYHYNPNYFIEVFKREACCTPYQYVIRMRMQKALQLMWQGIDVQRVAEQVGYADVSSFCRGFSRYFGMSPRHYMEWNGRMKYDA